MAFTSLKTNLFYRVIGYKIQQSSLTTRETIQVLTTKGPIKGVKRVSVYGVPYYSFENIPFAKPPLDDLRFKAPIPPDPWVEVKDCTQPCEKPLQENFVFTKYKGSEDCLYLNVFSKNLSPDKLSPVMVWIYGGGFQIGEASRDLYGPDYLMDKDVVYVSITYRLGPLGFLSLNDPKLNIPGNAGLKDQILGLRWVKENISRFGGDPENVTLFGESAGGTSTHLLMISPQTEGLFHKAIVQSGSALCHWAMPPANNWPYRLAVAMGLTGADAGDDKAVYEFLSKAKGTDIVSAAVRITNKDEKRNRVLFAFAPTIEPYETDDCVIPKEPLELMKTTWSNNIPLMIGGNSHEGLLFLPEIRRRPITLDEVENCEYLVPNDLGLDRSSEKCKQFGLQIKKTHFGDEECSSKTSMQYLDLLSYKMFWHGISRTVMSRLEFSKAPTYLYRFEFDSPFFNQIRNLICGKGHNGACHGDDICYLFYNTFSCRLSKDTPEYRTIERMIGIWTSFAQNGSPNCDVISDVNIQPLDKNETNLKCFNISNEVKIIDLPENEKLKIWDSMYEKSRLYGKT
ncbi:esterase B1-like isoform X2 [Eupeodes corollae]|uniref:esterase B1-like isoform X2 n=1 Tax=Eupeodes corollae TaxID=290404 RepID=UPI0024912E08|nr:esterase B1-like isoform X2 [Eupeodes corollae]